METEYLISVDEFCANHNIEISFVSLLQQSGLIELTTVEEEGFIEVDQLKQLEKFMRLYYELDINLEGIETINYLLQRIDSMQHEIVSLKNKLRIYETEF